MDTVSKVFGVAPPKVAVPTIPPTDCSNPTLLAGVELEIENCPKNGDWYLENLKKSAWTVTRDGSLRPPDTSFEFVSKPMQLQHLLSEMKLLFEKGKFDKPSNYSDRCSVHFHTNVTDFTQQQLATLALIYTIVEDVLFEFVNHHKAPTADGYSRDTNLYCIPWNQCRMNYSLVNKIFARGADTFRNWQKYTALNLVPVLEKGTVEWRHMHGTNDMEKLTTWANIIGSIMAFAKAADFEDMVKTVKALNDTSAYQQFFTSIFRDYLPYDERYREALAEGVINAKYSLARWELDKGKAPGYEEFIDMRLPAAAFDDEDEHEDRFLRELDQRRQRDQVQHVAAQLRAGRGNPAAMAEANRAFLWRTVAVADDMAQLNIGEGNNL